jgi:hypothetical protein
LRDTTFYSRLDNDLASTHQAAISKTIHSFIATGNLPETVKNLISSFLDRVMALLIKDLPSYIKDTKHAFQIFQNIHFHGTHKFIFTIDVKSLYTVIPHHDGLRALKFFLDKRPNQGPSTAVLVRLAELLLTLNNFSFDGEHYHQISGVAL